MTKRISVLEDDDSLRDLFTLLLEDEGYQVQAFSTVLSFRESLQQNLPDLFILDVRLPDGNGIEVCTLVKASSETKHIPVIMMSAHRNFERENGMCTAEAFIAKPFDILALMSQVSQIISKT